MEKRTLEDCVYKIQSNIMAYVTPEMEKCRNCSTYNMYQCDRYKNVRTTQLPIRYGKAAVARAKQFYHKYVSIEGLPHDEEEE